MVKRLQAYKHRRTTYRIRIKTTPQSFSSKHLQFGSKVIAKLRQIRRFIVETCFLAEHYFASKK